MKAKIFEIRDDGTFIPVLAVKLEPDCSASCYLLGRAGYGLAPASQGGYIVLHPLTGDNRASYDPSKLGGGPRTYPVAGRYIQEHFDELESGAVVDVEFILGERPEPKLSERLTAHGMRL